MSRYQPYLTYKASGVEWLGDVPEHWEVARNKSFLTLNKAQVGKDAKSFQLLSLTLNGVVTRDIESGVGKFPESFDTYQIVKSNDLVFCLFDMDETPRTVGLSKKAGMITNAYSVYKCSASTDAKYIYYYYLAIDFRKGLKPFYTGLRKTIRTETFDNIKLPLPPLSEQTTIANFLDTQTAKIDTLIAKQQRMIALLGEKRQAVISHAVTKGLNPDASMKDSGVEWLGDVPEHWEVKCLKRSLSIQNGKDYKEIQSDEGYPVYGSGGRFTWATDFLYEGEAVLLGRKGTIDKPLFVNEAFWTVDTMYYGTPKNSDVGKFIYYCATVIPFRLYSTDTALPSMTQTALNEHLISIPSSSEQTAIANHLDTQTAKIDTLISKANQAITLLQERRSALISAAVTGKIDVRKTA